MKHLLASILTFYSVSGVLQAQPELTYQNLNPTAGQVYKLYNFNGVSVDEGAAGAQVSWDFSNLSSSVSTTLRWLDPAATPRGSQFPGATIAQSFSNETLYSRINSQGYDYLGNTFGSVVVHYDDPETYFAFPFRYQDTQEDDFSGSYQINNLNITRTGHISARADAYGTLFLPGGIKLDEVLRVKLEEHYVDSTTVGGNTMRETTSATFTNWYQAGITYPVLVLIDYEHNGQKQKFGYYMDASHLQTVGIKSFEQRLQLKLYPNPAIDVMHLEWDQATSVPVTLLLYDWAGRIVVQENIQEYAGAYTVAMQQMPKGVYWLRLESANICYFVKKVIKY